MDLTAWDFFVLDQITKEQNVEAVARHLANNYAGRVGPDAFCQACRACGVDADDFDADDIRAIQDALDRM